MSGLPLLPLYNALRVLIAEPTPNRLEDLVRLLGKHPEVEVTGMAADAGHARRLAAHVAPDALLVGERLLDGDARAALAALAPHGRPPPVVALVDERQAAPVRPRVLALLDAGIAGFVSSRDAGATLVHALRAVVRGGEVYLSPRVAAHLAAPEGAGGHDPLTRREREVLMRAALGHPNARIAHDLGLAPGTVRAHLSDAYAKLGVRTRAEAVAWAWRRGILSPEG